MNQLNLIDALDHAGPYNGGAGFKTHGTSEEAARKITPTLQAAYDEIIAVLKLHGPMRPAIIAQHTGRPLSYTAPRCTEMVRHHKMLVRVGREKNESGMSAYVLDIKRDDRASVLGVGR